MKRFKQLLEFEASLNGYRSPFPWVRLYMYVVTTEPFVYGRIRAESLIRAVFIGVG